jgi:AcrR family transcriptional regulator
MAGPARGAARVRLSGAARREQLLEIGRRVFAERGFEAASVEEIAERARVSKPIVYEHFGGKEGLYAAVVDRETEAILDRITAAISTGTARERFERAALAFLEYAADRPEGFQVLFHDAPGRISSLLSTIAERVARIVAAELARAGYDPAPAPIYAHALVGMVAFVGRWWTETGTPSVDVVASHLAALGWMGLRHLPRRPAPVRPLAPVRPPARRSRSRPRRAGRGT